MYLPDINIWLALTFEVHSHHRRAVAWFGAVELECCTFCRLTQQGYLRLATNPAVFKEEAVTMARAWSCYDQLLADERVRFTPEPGGLETAWRQYTSRGTFSPKIWNDAYLAAFGRTANLEVVTFDSGFRGYSDVGVTVLT